MAIDLEAIRKRVAELSGAKRTSSVNLWKPGIGEYKIRCLPWKNGSDSSPFIEKWFYYIGNNPGILTPKQFGKPDPIDDLIRKCYQSGRQEDKALAKKLHPKMRAYAPVIIRGEEDKGVFVWSFGKMVYQRLLGFFIDEDYGNILDPNEGYDLKVTISQAMGKDFKDTVVDCKGKQSRLHEDPAKVKELLEAVPNIDDMYRQKSTQEIENILNNWLTGGEANVSEPGTTRGVVASDDPLDILAREVTTEVKAPVPAVKVAATQAAVEMKTAVPKKATKKPIVDDDVPVKKQTLDEAFNELMEDE